jgi:hypothetical protein
MPRLYANQTRESILLRQPNSTVDVLRPLTISNGDHRLNARLARPRQNRLAVSVVPLAIEMCMGIYKHSRWSLVVGRSRIGFPKDQRHFLS